MIELDIYFVKSKISDVCFNKLIKVKIDSDENLLLENLLDMHNVVILIKSVFNKKNIIVITIKCKENINK